MNLKKLIIAALISISITSISMLKAGLISDIVHGTEETASDVAHGTEDVASDIVHGDGYYNRYYYEPNYGYNYGPNYYDRYNYRRVR